jgi:hypothetical protein
VIFQVEVIWVGTPCCVLVGHKHCRGPCYLHLQGELRIPTFQRSVLLPSSGWSEDWGIMDLWNVGILPQHCTASNPRKPRLERLYLTDFVPSVTRTDHRWSGVRVPEGVENFSLHHRVQTGSAAHPVSCPMGIKCFFPGSKAAGGWS